MANMRHQVFIFPKNETKLEDILNIFSKEYPEIFRVHGKIIKSENNLIHISESTKEEDFHRFSSEAVAYDVFETFFSDDTDLKGYKLTNETGVTELSQTLGAKDIGAIMFLCLFGCEKFVGEIIL